MVVLLLFIQNCNQFHIYFIINFFLLIILTKYRKDATHQGQAKSIIQCLWLPLCGPCVTLGYHLIQLDRISHMLGFLEGGGKTKEPREKPPKSRVENEHKFCLLVTSHIGRRCVTLWYHCSSKCSAQSIPRWSPKKK